LSLFQELKRRNVFRVGIAYAVAGWLVLQLTDVLSELLDLPATVGPIVVAIVAIGFPIALVFAWAYELTPEGVKRESDVDRDRSIAGSTGRTLDRVIIALLVVVAGYFIYESRFAGTSNPSPADTAENQVADADAPAALTANLDEAPTEDAVDPHSIAVLPFDNRSRNEDDAFFVEGIHDDLLTNLARIAELKVISRTSVLRYEDTTQPIPEIAKELGVATVMEGAVQRSGDTVRVNVQLIDAETDEHLWAEIFDRELTADNLFAIQTEISQRIAEALETTLTPEETERISDRPTENLVAYSAYLRGTQLLNQRTSDSVIRAVEELESAVTEDPEFALAWAVLAEAYSLTATYSDVLFVDALASRKTATERALALNPNLGLAWSLHASNLRVDERYDEAEAAFRRSIELAPNNPRVLQEWANFLAFGQHRPMDALEPLGRAIELDPYSSNLRMSRAGLLTNARRYPQARSEYEALLRMDPSYAAAHGSLATLLATHLFDFRSAIGHAERAIELDSGNPSHRLGFYFILLDLGATERAAQVQQILETDWPGHWTGPYLEFVDQLTATNYGGAIENLRALEPMFGVLPGFFGSLEATVHALAEDHRRAYAVLVEREPRVLQPEIWERWIPTAYQSTCDMGVILMRGDSPELGRQLAERTLDYVLALNAQGGDPHRRELESCYAALGQSELALVAMEQRLAHNHILGLSGARQSLWPGLLEDDSRFVALLQATEERVALERERLVSEGVL
jgi:TolB-like protein/tetratricopeptide (TPR) repeat protein